MDEFVSSRKWFDDSLRHLFSRQKSTLYAPWTVWSPHSYWTDSEGCMSACSEPTCVRRSMLNGWFCQSPTCAPNIERSSFITCSWIASDVVNSRFCGLPNHSYGNQRATWWSVTGLNVRGDCNVQSIGFQLHVALRTMCLTRGDLGASKCNVQTWRLLSWRFGLYAWTTASNFCLTGTWWCVHHEMDFCVQVNVRHRLNLLYHKKCCAFTFCESCRPADHSKHKTKHTFVRSKLILEENLKTMDEKPINHGLGKPLCCKNAVVFSNKTRQYFPANKLPKSSNTEQIKRWRKPLNPPRRPWIGRRNGQNADFRLRLLWTTTAPVRKRLCSEFFEIRHAVMLDKRPA